MENFNLIGEFWRPVKGYEGLYEVSNLGRVRSLNYNHTGKICTLKNVKQNVYLAVNLYCRGESKFKHIHRLVAETFLPNPFNLPCVNHKDENGLNNFVFCRLDGSVDPSKSNLEWCSYKYNSNYGTSRSRLSAALKGKKRNTATIEKLRNNAKGNTYRRKSIKSISKDGNVVFYDSLTLAAIAIGGSVTAIVNCLKGRAKTSKGLRWEYIT